MKRQGATDLVRGAVSRQRQAQTADQEAEARLFQDQDASRMAGDAAAAAGENASGQVRFCFYTPTVVVMQPSDGEADQTADELVKMLADRGFTARIETINALEAWLGSLPGHGFPQPAAALLHSRNVADRAAGAADPPPHVEPPRRTATSSGSPYIQASAPRRFAPACDRSRPRASPPPAPRG